MKKYPALRPTSLTEVAERYSTQAHNFKSVYKQNKKCIHGFLEGTTDEGLYKPYLRRHLQPHGFDFKPWVVDGKPGVQKHFRSISWENYDLGTVLFFVDRDFTDFRDDKDMKDFASDPSVYVTDGHSIENSVVSRAACEFALRRLFDLEGPLEEDLNSILDNFSSQLQIFDGYMTAIMAPLIVGHKMKLNPVLKRVKLQTFFCFSVVNHQCILNVIDERSATDLAKFSCERAGLNYDDLADAIESMRSHLSEKEAHNFVHGKFALWFMVEYIRHSKAIVEESLGKPVDVEVYERFSKNALYLLGEDVHIPTLEDFITRTALRFVESMGD